MEIEIEQLEELMANLPDVCDGCGKMKAGDQLNYFADGHKLCDECFAGPSAKSQNRSVAPADALNV